MASSVPTARRGSPAPTKKRVRRSREQAVPQRLEEGRATLRRLTAEAVRIALAGPPSGVEPFEMLQRAASDFREKLGGECGYGGVPELLLHLAARVDAEGGYARILRGASHAFCARGVDATRIEDILLQASVSPRTYYQFFRNKSDVLEALYDLLLDIMMATTGACVGRHGPQAFPAALANGMVAGAPLLGVLMGEALRAGSPLAPKLEATGAALTQLLLPAYTAVEPGKVPHPAWVRSRAGTLAGLIVSLDLKPDATAQEREVARVLIADVMRPEGMVWVAR